MFSVQIEYTCIIANFIFLLCFYFSYFYFSSCLCCMCRQSAIWSIMCPGCPSVPFPSTQYLKNASRELLQLWYKYSLGLEDDLIRFWWSKVKGHMDLIWIWGETNVEICTRKPHWLAEAYNCSAVIQVLLMLLIFSFPFDAVTQQNFPLGDSKRIIISNYIKLYQIVSNCILLFSSTLSYICVTVMLIHTSTCLLASSTTSVSDTKC